MNGISALIRASQMVLGVKNMSAVQVDLRDADLIPGLGRSPGGGHGNTLQDSCLENPMDRGAWVSPWGRKESDTTERLSSRQDVFIREQCREAHEVLKYF